MDLLIRKYQPAHDYDQLIAVIRNEGSEWEEYLQPKYAEALASSVSYVAEASGNLCGYVRAIRDADLYIWVIDLLVHPAYRGHSIGKKLMDSIAQAHPSMDIYVLSDVDGYYQKLGFKKEGSVIKYIA